MDDLAAPGGEVHTTGLGRVRIVRSDWTIVDGADGTRLATPPRVRPGDQRCLQR
jgi:hypothetical protein